MTSIGVEYMGEPVPERTLWPVRPYPMPDELLSSWLNRVATANGMAPRSFYLSLAKELGCPMTIMRFENFLGERLKSRETSWVDFRCHRHLAQYLSQRTGMREKLIQGLALKRPPDTPAGIVTPAGTLQWALVEAVPKLLLSEGRGYSYIRFCPYCLAEWDDPWYRKLWRTSLATVCIRHGCQLLLTCPCGSTVRPHLSEEARSQAFCHACGQDLRLLEAKPAFPHEMRDQKEANRRAYEEVESILRNRGQKWRVKQLIDTLSHSKIIIDLRRRVFPLCKTGLIDAYRSDSALSLWMIYRDLRRRRSEKTFPESSPISRNVHYRY